MLFRLATIRLILFCALATLAAGQIKIERGNYKGWTKAIFITNDTARIVVVPSVGRVMQFGLAGEEGVFWENEKLTGKTFSPEAKEWFNFGGDKVWAAPIADWRKIMKRGVSEPNFPPAPGFDGLPFTAKIKKRGVELVGQVDPFYGIRVRRIIRLDDAAMHIETVFEKIEGEPVKVSVWTVTQLENPEKIFLLLPEKSIFANGFTRLSAEAPPSLKREERLVWLERNEQKPHKIGSDALKMLWVGKSATIEMSAPRFERAEYPDAGSSVEVYTAPDPLAYVELETLGELRMLVKGQKMSLTTTYVLRRRAEKDARAEAERLWLRK